MSEPTDRPLHVQVAEALGWTITVGGLGNTPDGRYAVEIPDYDTDWSATGPLIEQLGINLERQGKKTWQAWVYPLKIAQGETPRIAVCNLIVALAAATPTGKLELGQHGAQS